MSSTFQRRTMLGAGIASLAGLAAAAPATAANKGSAPTLTDKKFSDLLASVPMDQVGAELAFEAVVDIAPSEDLGAGPLGGRRIVPITGGRFKGPRISGTVEAGGADRQLVRGDGIRMLEATYELRTDDGAVLNVVNNVLIDQPAPDQRYARSFLTVSAPTGPHDWLNRRILVGTLNSLKPTRDAVLVRVFVLT
ncbi:hypothetical protein D477_009855 [Arthrobacter crystallopoietes BAB-32]|uniref:Uncharacterized protein n=1 Tax=Arthrobacter crystallopoietes BAB-32 TaxID=1246476 RepID=N1V320_9MICC|nr:DUF3237 domain-containing protein [Arthrobacter crystallopoietes]EMY34394.1 hypothetical protein D477_009855 [Arthrobacter crystallopoietes BAB-32]